ncbi:MAG: hypothetical protein ACRCZA_00120 [Shewanella sp.]|uniref:hypothetical protein n=1 Tax=Shewanella sp. TaxID=50422 RepID=UPI003F3CCAE3
MTIPAFTLPSNAKKTIIFRENTVADCLDFCGLDDRLDEVSTTTYLNALQVGEVYDSALWTTQDRRTALWWIFVISNQDTTIALDYECEHCGKRHTADIDMMRLDEGVRTITSDCFIKTELLFDGVERQITIKPITGQEAMYMERQGLALLDLDEDSLAYRQELARLKVVQLACAFRFELEPDDFEEALDMRISAIKTMKRTSEFRMLVASIESAFATLAHGLDAVLEQGQLALVSYPVACESYQPKEGEQEDATPATRLLIPFQGKLFIPEL